MSMGQSSWLTMSEARGHGLTPASAITSHPQMFGLGQQQRRGPSRLVEELGLTEEQARQMEAVRQEARAGGVSRGGMRERIEQILTPEQREKMRSRRGRRLGAGGGLVVALAALGAYLWYRRSRKK